MAKTLMVFRCIKHNGNGVISLTLCYFPNVFWIVYIMDTGILNLIRGLYVLTDL